MMQVLAGQAGFREYSRRSLHDPAGRVKDLGLVILRNCEGQ